MTQLIIFNKPYGVQCQFSPIDGVPTLADYIPVQNIYPAGRLDKNSEGLLLLTDDGKLQNRIASPKYKLSKTYWVQVEGTITDRAIQQLRDGVALAGVMTKPAKVSPMDEPLAPRNPPIRVRKNIPTSWIQLTLTEGKNRQVRRMTAASGFPTLRLYRHQIGRWTTDDLQPGEYATTTY